MSVEIVEGKKVKDLEIQVYEFTFGQELSFTQ